MGSREVPDPPSLMPIAVAAGRWTFSTGFAHLHFPNTSLLNILAGNTDTFRILEEPLVPKASPLPIFIC